MRKMLLVFLLLNTVTIVNAQWRLQVQSGPSTSLNPVDRDSLFSAQKAGFHSQVKAVYFWGHLGFGLTLGHLKQTVRTDAHLNKPPSILNGLDTMTQQGGGVSSVYFLIGPEFCFGCHKKLKFNFGIRAGLSFIKKEAFQLLRQNSLQYENVLQSKAPFTFNMGVGFHYFISEHFGMGAMFDYHHFGLKAENKDIRRGINNILVLKQKKDLFNTGLSLVFKF